MLRQMAGELAGMTEITSNQSKKRSLKPLVKHILPVVKYILPLVEYILPLVKYNSNQSNQKGEVVFRPKRGSKLQTWLFLACEAS